MLDPERIARKYADRWAPSSPEFGLPEAPHGIGLIMKATHGATKERLTHGSWETTQETARMCRMYPDARVMFSTYARNPKPSVEEYLVKSVLRGSTCVGEVLSTTAEAIALKEACGAEPGTMLIVTDEFNSWRTRNIYQVFFPNTEIYILAIPAGRTLDSRSPIVNFRNLNRAIWWETLIPCGLFWVMAKSGKIGKRMLILLSNSVVQKSSS